MSLSICRLSQLLCVLFIVSSIVGCQSVHLKKTDETTHSPTTTNTSPPATEEAPKAVEKSTYNTVWDRIRAGYGLAQVSNSRIDAQLKFYANNRAYFSKLSQQSEPYLYYVVKEFEANKIPLEFVLIPFVESAYNPSAHSAGNAGMWQLAAATGKNFGLKRNNNYDGRKDVVASTQAVIRLLKTLNNMFDGDWLLTLGAYNAGEGYIQQVIAKNKRMGKSPDIWSLPPNHTTQEYIPRLLALAKVVAEPDRYGYKLYPIPDAPYFEPVKVEFPVSFNAVAEAADLSITQIKQLNTGFNGTNYDPSITNQLLVPSAAAQKVTANLNSLPRATLPPTTTSSESEKNSKSTATQNKNTLYTVKSGDNLWDIAKSHKLSVTELMKLNNLNNKSTLKPGQKLIVTK